mmetsp:Transcript_35210/g.110517  ORF Transcript_35210/g.110517 Transcript_35210/m.110517 type:complete len:145 (-) Transcript_35210:58-492(-)
MFRLLMGRCTALPRLASQRSQSTSSSPGGRMVAAAASGDSDAAFAAFKRQQEELALRRDRQFIYSGLLLAGIALFFSVRLSQRARIHEDERHATRLRMYAQIEESDQRRERLLGALPELAQTAARLKPEAAARVAAEVRHVATK